MNQLCYCNCRSGTITDGIAVVNVDVTLFINSGDEDGMQCSHGYEPLDLRFKGHENSI